MSTKSSAVENGEKIRKLDLVKEEEGENEQDEEEKEVNPPSPQSTNYPCTFGPGSEYVKLVSGDNHEFYIQRELAEKSVTIQNMLRTPGGVNHENVVYLRMISSRSLNRICNYLRYQKLYVDKQGEVDPFVVEPELGLELIMAASFLGI